MNLSPHFTLEELTASQTAVRKGINNTPPAEPERKLYRVAQLLEQIRAWVNRPISVSSGYRCPALNAAVGGAKDSAHVKGLAADINASGMTARELAIAIRDSDIQFDQLIHEGTWVHVGLSEGLPRREVLTAHFGGGAVTYTRGIE